MEKVLIAIASLALLSSPSLSQGMRDAIREYDSYARCFSKEKGGNIEVCLYGNGNIHFCPGLNVEDCAGRFLDGKINRRMRHVLTYVELTEYYVEEGNLVKYYCDEGAYMQCDGRPDKVVYYPL